MSLEAMDNNAYVNGLLAELAEARAQIRHIDHAYGKVQHRYEEAVRQRDEARAQIAAKDAALREIADECRSFPITDGLAFRCESIALNALTAPAINRDIGPIVTGVVPPAQETE